MLAQLARVTTADGVRLDGALLPPAADAGGNGSLDAVLLIHGTGANFYASSLLEALAKHFTGRGVAALLANTRGRDLVYTASTSDGPRRQGAAYERVDDCRFDLAAWLQWLGDQGHQRVGIIGHSLGAIKAVYVLTQPDPPEVEWLCAISPARLSHEHFLASSHGARFRRTLELAQRHVDDGNPDTLIEVGFPIPYVVTAAGYLDKYGPHERFNVLKHLDRLGCRTLFTFGSVEVQSHVAFRGLPEAIEAASRGRDNIQVATIAGADHVYSGARAELIRRIDAWL